MTKGVCLAVLMLLIGSCLMLPASSQEQVSQTVYVYDGDFNGTLLSGVQVVGQDATGKSFSGITDSNGVAVVSGQPGTWLFVFIKDGYETLDLSYNVTETDEGAVYLVKSNQLTGQIAPSLNNQQPEAISEANTDYQTQLETNASSLDQVSQTVYVYDGDFNGTLLSDVQVSGQDAAGKSFSGITDSNGVAIVSGQPGTWQFEFAKVGYETVKLSYNVTETGEGAVYLVRSSQLTGQIAPSLNNQQSEAISKDNTAYQTQVQNSKVSQETEINEPETASAEYWLENGNVLYGQGRYDEAAKSYDRCILLNPQLEAAWFNKGNALYMQGDYDNALSAFDKAIEINPQDANTWICRGLTLKKLGRTLEANAAFMQAKQLGYTG
ncbi:MAG: tetratricopeptide repeat protein [Methanothrix sp.]|nr:tetratricopeptide repeat protein [Methanothrix sp.]